MKTGYQKPTIVFEDFELNAAIATGCQSIVSLGPGDLTHPICKEYEGYDELRVRPEYGLMGSTPTDVSFYEKSCSCYLSSVGSTLLTS